MFEYSHEDRGLGDDASFEEMLTEAARGLYGVCDFKGKRYAADGIRLQPHQCRGRRHGLWNSMALRRVGALGSVALDKHIELRMRRLPLNTITLYQQP